MKKLILTSSTMLCIGLLAFAYENNKHVKQNSKAKQANGFKIMKAGLRPDDRPQATSFGVQPKNAQHITQAQLKGAHRLSDIISEYPFNWITSYISVEMSATCNGKAVTAVSTNDTLNSEQVKLLNTIDMNSGLTILVNYTYKAPVTNIIEKNTMHISMTIVPDVEAEYAGGKEKMAAYLNEHVNAFFRTIPEQFQQATIRFAVDEGGNITNARISNQTGYDKVYMALVDAIYKMPQWKPAENSKGVRVKQEFEFTVGRYGC